MYLLACQVKVTVGYSGLCCFRKTSSYRANQLVLFVDPAPQALLFYLTPLLPRCRLKTTNESAKFEIPHPLSLFALVSERISIKTHSIESSLV